MLLKEANYTYKKTLSISGEYSYPRTSQPTTHWSIADSESVPVRGITDRA
jgi:hypothetical protein